MERQQGQKEKSIAWFKLADLIARGEREKALSVFRLLSHSLTDRAYALQVEGDILWHMNDQSFQEKYKQAAFLYQKELRWVNAIALYEHLLTEHPDAPDVLMGLIFFYAMIDWREKCQQSFDRAYDLFQKKIIDEAAIEKTVKELVNHALTTQHDEKKAWLRQWLSQLPAALPLPAHFIDAVRVL